MKNGQHKMELVLLEGTEIFGLNMLRREEIPAADLRAADPGVIELPAALAQRLEWARGSVASAEADVLKWLSGNGRTAMAGELSAGYEKSNRR